MTALIILWLVFAVLGLFSYNKSEHGSADDFGSGIVAMICAAMTIFLTFIISGLWLYQHITWR